MRARRTSTGGGGAAVRDEAVLVVEGLRTWFRTPRGIVHAVDDVSFSLDKGETIGIVGESGSGKSVLARSIMGLVPDGALTDGRVLFRGRDLVGLPPAEARKVWGSGIAMVFQNSSTSLNPVMKVGTQIMEPLRAHLGLDRAAARERAAELLRVVGIPEAERRLASYPPSMSGGMRQRVCIAMAIACGPDVVLADEPTTALDVTIQRQILDLLDGLRRERGMGLVLISHDLGVVAGRADRVMVMYAGRVVESGPTVALFQRPRHPYTRALLAAIPRLAQPSHTRLSAIPGRPPEVLDPKPGCRFAARCSQARDRCHDQDPVLAPAVGDPGHEYACFYPNDVADGSPDVDADDSGSA